MRPNAVLVKLITTDGRFVALCSHPSEDEQQAETDYGNFSTLWTDKFR